MDATDHDKHDNLTSEKVAEQVHGLADNDTDAASAPAAKIELEDAGAPAAESRQAPVSGRPMQKSRFLAGLLFSGLGLSLMLAVAVGALQDFGLSGRFSLPAVGGCMVIGLMLVGGGFGMMATAAPRFDDDEFDRLVQADNNAEAVSRAISHDRIHRSHESSGFQPRDTQRPEKESAVASP